MRMYFSDKDQRRKEENPVLTKLKANSTFDPPISNSMLDVFQQLVTDNVTKNWDKHSKHHTGKSNISHKQKQAMTQLKEDNTVTIKKADKGGAIVVMDTTSYIGEAQNQLTDETVYQKLTSDPTMQFKEQLDKVIEEAYDVGLIDSDIKNVLIKDNPRTPILYLVPKVHKSLQSPPGRPIVSSVGSILQPIAVYFDSYLQNIVKKTTLLSQGYYPVP